MEAQSVIDTLGLGPHPEGGHYRETYSDAAGSAIYFLLRRGEESAWHRVLGRAEIWHFYAGAPLELSVAGDAGGGPDPDGDRIIRLGSEVAAGERPQAVVPADHWQRARSTGEWTLVGCTVAPPFTFDAFEMRG